MSLDVRVFDELAPNWQTVCDVYTPQLSRFEPTTPFSDDWIEHIDVVTTWKGLPTSQRAEELLFWENAFRSALDSIVEEWLQEKMRKKNIDLTLQEDVLPLHSIHHMIAKLGVRSIQCNLSRIVDYMLWYHECSGLFHPWFLSRGDSRIAIENFIHLHTCFCSRPQIQSGNNHATGIRVNFTSQIHPNGVQIFGVVQSKPHTLHLRHSHDGAGIEFDPPRLEDASPSYRVTINTHFDGTRQDLYNCFVRTHFPDGVIFERAYRIRVHMSVRQPEWYIKGMQTAQEVVQDIKREQGIKENVPRTGLREVSTNSVRVQGVSLTDLEREARTVHPGLYNAHQDVSVHKSSVFDKIGDQNLASAEATKSRSRSALFDEIFGDQKPTPADIVVNTARVSAAKIRSQAPSRLDSAYTFSPVDASTLRDALGPEMARLRAQTPTPTSRKHIRHSYDDQSDTDHSSRLVRISHPRIRKHAHRASTATYDSNNDVEDMPFVSPRAELAHYRQMRDLELRYQRKMNEALAENQKLRAQLEERTAAKHLDKYLRPSRVPLKKTKKGDRSSPTKSDTMMTWYINSPYGLDGPSPSPPSLPAPPGFEGKGKEKVTNEESKKDDSPMKQSLAAMRIPTPDQMEIQRNYKEFWDRAMEKEKNGNCVSRFSTSEEGELAPASSSSSEGYISGELNGGEEEREFEMVGYVSPPEEPTAEISKPVGFRFSTCVDTEMGEDELVD